MAPSLSVKAISDTAFLTAFYRAIESDRPDAHFHDPYARALAGVRGEQLTQIMPEAKSVAQGSTVRTCVMDELILRTVEQEGVDTILNLGAGLDTRPYRLPLPTSLRWIEADLPSVLVYKASKLSDVQPTCVLESVQCDLSDPRARQTLFEQANMRAKQMLVITEGLLIYMTPEQVTTLAKDLHTYQSIHGWLTDITSPSGLRQIRSILPGSLIGDDVKMQFAPAEGIEFFCQCGWQPAEFRSFFEEAQRLNRGALPGDFLAQLSPEHWDVWRSLSGVVLLTRVDDHEHAI